jgi:flagellar motor protein MotB
MSRHRFSVAAAVVLLLPGCGATSAQYEKRTEELHQAEERARRCWTQLHDAEGGRAEAQLQTDALRMQLRRYQDAPPLRAAEATRRAPEPDTAAERAAAERAREREALGRGLADEIAAGAVTLVERQGTSRLVLPGDRLFTSGQAALGPAARRILDAVARELGRLGPRRVLVAAHGDDRPPRTLRSGGLPLTLERADRVAAELVRAGLDAANLGRAGFGDIDPLTDDGSDEGRARNRRVELALLGVPPVPPPPPPPPTRRPPSERAPIADQPPSAPIELPPAPTLSAGRRKPATKSAASATATALSDDPGFAPPPPAPEPAPTVTPPAPTKAPATVRPRAPAAPPPKTPAAAEAPGDDPGI